MEKVVTLDPRAWAGKRVFLTGHTGFKGSWLALWLRQLGAEVYGYSLAPETTPNLFTAADVEPALAGHTLADIRDAEALRTAMTAARPDVVFHLAAQPLVRASYNDPVGTYATNVMGTVNVLEAARGCTNLAAIVVATTDKCYDNREWAWGYRETDALGGHDPYSASKACAELVVASYRRAFFANGLCRTRRRKLPARLLRQRPAAGHGPRRQCDRRRRLVRRPAHPRRRARDACRYPADHPFAARYAAVAARSGLPAWVPVARATAAGR